MPNPDPRLRILDTSTTAAADVIAALDATTVVIRIGAEVSGPARVAAGALAAMAARLFGHVEVHGDTTLPTNWWGLADISELVAAASALISPHLSVSKRTLTVVVGSDATGEADFGIGGGDFVARLARHAVPVSPGTHYLGLHAAACLAVSQLMGIVLADHGVGVVELVDDYTLDLLTHRPVSQHKTVPAEVVAATGQDAEFELVFGGVGSVGSSAVALSATALAPAYNNGVAPPGLTISLVDLDRFDPARNPFRYPALLGGETEPKADALAIKLRAAGLDATGHTAPVGTWAVARDSPGVRGLFVSSVDTLAGRLEVADVLAEQTLSIGVSGLLLHAQRERMDGTSACPFCDYVDSAPAHTQAEVYVEMTGLELPRVLQLLEPATLLTEQDVAAAVAAGKLSTARAGGLAGHRLEDLVNRVYAEASVRASTGETVAAVAFPQVSWFAGVLAAVEIVKQIRGLPMLEGRVDVDLAGLPPGAVRLMPPDPSGRCVCHSGVRRRAYLQLYAEPVAAEGPAG